MLYLLFRAKNTAQNKTDIVSPYVCLYSYEFAHVFSSIGIVQNLEIQYVMVLYLREVWVR